MGPRFSLKAMLALCAPLLWALPGCFSKFELGVAPEGNNVAITLDDDSTHNYAWSTASLIKGNQTELTLQGNCGSDVGQVAFAVNGSSVGNAPCKDGRYAMHFPNNQIFSSNDRYSIDVAPIMNLSKSRGPSLGRIYDLYKVDGQTLVSVTTPSSVSTTTFAANQGFSGTCRSDEPGIITITVGGSTTTCRGGESFTVASQALAIGANNFAPSWIDEYGNQYVASYTVVRNDSGSAVLVASTMSFVPVLERTEVLGDSGSASLSSISGMISDFNHRPGFVPSGVTVSSTLALAISPDASSACSGSCDTGALGFGNLSLIYAP